MNVELWLAYLGVVMAYMITPGPSHILMLSNSLGNGFNRSLATAAGDLSANFLQMLAASLGLAAIVQSSQIVFFYIKWVGVLYLVYLGIKLIRAGQFNFSEGSQRTRQSLYWQGFITSAANPKAVIFFAALFPQFINLSEPLWPQFFALSLTYLIIDGLFLCFYGKFADAFAGKYQSNFGHYFNKLSGCLFIGAAVMLSLKDIQK